MLSSLLSPSNPQSWTAFQRDVYRPRVALFLLALLLASSTSPVPGLPANNNNNNNNKNAATTDSRPASEVNLQKAQPGAIAGSHAKQWDDNHVKGAARTAFPPSSPLFGLSYSDFLFRPDRVIRRTSQHLFTHEAAAPAPARHSASSPGSSVANVASQASPSFDTVSSPSSPAARPTARDKMGRSISSPPRPAPAKPSQQHLEHPFKQLQRAKGRSGSVATPSRSDSRPQTISKPAQRNDAPHNRSYNDRPQQPAEPQNMTFSMDDIKTSLRAHRNDFVVTLQAGLNTAGLGSFTHPNVLPLLLLLHVMLGVRLAGMFLDDAINQNLFTLAQQAGTSLRDIPRNRKSARVLWSSFLSVVMLLSVAAFACTPSALDGMKQSVRGIFGAARESTNGSPEQVLADALPVRAVLIFEFLSTVLSLTLPLYHLLPLLASTARSGSVWRYPRTVTLPSPSHSPSVSEILHLPEWICAAFDPQARAQAQARSRALAQERIAAAAVPGARRIPLQPLSGANAADSETLASTAVRAPLVDALAQAAFVGVPRHRLRRSPLGLGMANDDPAPEASIAPESEASGPGLRNPLNLSMVAERLPAPSSPSPSSSSSSSSPQTPRPGFNLSSTSPSGGGAPAVSGKSLRLERQRVRVQLGWFLETLVGFFDRLVGVTIYGLAVLSLPTLTPTSIYPLVALLALRNEIGQLVVCWTKARQTVECLEFVRRRWGAGSALRARIQALRKTGSAKGQNVSLVHQAVWDGEEQVCCMCFEPTPAFPARSRSGSTTEGASSDGGRREEEEEKEETRKQGRSHPDSSDTDEAEENTCVLDCTHVLHADCLVTWLRAQNFCPVCHAPLQGTPPGWVPTPPTSPGLARGAGAQDDVAAGGILI
ncbi:unnamed protein product [Tilletia controversa]|uniref:RING-type domain-containing protein n=2 Tax=Tilletia TaxID=13289 RepID=A0A177UT51_9BASI|nr:hypothetical protein CF336_g1829 [Tilletia laevis]KAE8263863.1 hypothetical protein A4X03_0g1365 [Tilletia caries]CAD6950527.1 unnamed protein product [Tilletia controversa]KAE8207267.1 hypothetical protein CF335_g1267 [Tilletia laevis]CAD6890304.1 unnamed protein product [Tilletia caries]